MARKALVARNEKRKMMAKKYEAKRRALKLAGDWEGLQLLPRNSCPVRIMNRCCVTHRARGYLRDFGISRIVFREEASKGNIPGVRKSSW